MIEMIIKFTSPAINCNGVNGIRQDAKKRRERERERRDTMVQRYERRKILMGVGHTEYSVFKM